ncbi:CPBP family intramembrane glutamic endopeptidase [Fodinibius sediminis]|uniref:CAAX protease self-immunity n=1 Tax=Fodinibius sediminis TaxID=1214077 RepID=A0A521AHH1_9BACT|nr:CPBP family intramembrane glutamic endopeptidase [Fodinibius sediminis]SMO34252.1 CAAX protease self-immunity [Fodinibius sediminis]
MPNIKQPIQRYFTTTHSLLYSYLVSLPLLLLYEVLIFISQPDSNQVVRISVDIWIKMLFSYVGQDVLSITLILVALIGIYILYRERDKLSSLRFSYFMTMLIEASVYAFVLSVLISITVANLLQMIQASPVESLSLVQQMALSLGAGLYEELFFRVLLVSALLWFFNSFFAKKTAAYTAAIVLAAVIFSLVHYTGSMGETFTLASFLFRFLFGLALNAIYLWRGFGMAAWTHAIYDLMVIVF